jgi:ankyrin repeat protein
LIAACCAFVLLFAINGQSAGSDVADAAMHRDVPTVRTLLRQKADVNAPQADGATAIHWAVQNDDLELADILIQAGANVKAANRFEVTPLGLACMNGSAAMIQKLLKAGADVNAPFSPLGETPIMIAARTGNPDAVKVLLDNGANVNAREKSKGHTALMWAAAESHPSVVKLLLEHGADANLRSNAEAPPAGRRGGGAGGQNQARAGAGQRGAGGTAAAAPPQPVCPAKGTPRPEFIFGQAGGATRTNATGGGCVTALIFAARQNDIDSARFLLEKGADVNLTMADGTSALVTAIINAHYQLASFLLEKGADPNIADGKGRAGLYAAVDQRNYMVTDIPQPKSDGSDTLILIKALMDRGADVNQRLTAKLPYRGAGNPTWQSEVGATPFLRAAYSNDIVVMRLLLAYGADPNIPASDKTTPLMAAAGVGWLPSLVYTRNENLIETLKLCLELGNPISATNDGKPNSGGPSGVTALHGAAFKGLPEAVQFLVDHGADIWAKDTASERSVAGTPETGRTPLEWAEGISFEGQSPRREEKTVELLKKLMAASPRPAH